MKKIYSLLFVAFLAGSVMAQSANITPNNSDNKVVNTTKGVSVSSTEGKTNTTVVPTTTVGQTGVVGQNTTKSTGNPTGPTTASSTSVSGLPGFPVFVSTGNVDADNANYKAAKDAWIQNNPELYKNATKSSESNTGTRTNPNNK